MTTKPCHPLAPRPRRALGPLARAARLAPLVAALAAACGPAHTGPRGAGAAGAPDETTVGEDHRSPLQRRQAAACAQLGPRITACAVEDARATMTPAEFQKTTTPEIQRRNTQEYVEKCEGATLSSRQVRVLEVCFREESACEPLLACLEHLAPEPSRP